MGSYDVAQVCRNGHVANDAIHAYPHRNERFCAKCGAATITACEGCDAPIRGSYQSEEVFGAGLDFEPPAHCRECGAAYPWTATALDSARELADELDGLDDDDRAALKGTLDDLVGDGPRTQLASLRFKKLAGKTGREGAAMLRSVLAEVVSEAARKAIWGA